MRKRRFKLDGEGWYHLTSRCVLKQFLFGDMDKSMFARMLRACAEFCGIEVVTFCVMSNHIHILAHVPPKRVVPEDEVLRRVEVLYGTERMEDMRERWKAWRRDGMARLADEELAILRRRMGDVSPFMQILKQRFSVWYRARHGRLPGTIWQSRFNSTIIEGSAAGLEAVAAYIDLNPVRAGIVSDPKDYMWSGYGAAMLGNVRARGGLAMIFGENASRNGFAKVIDHYRTVLYAKGAANFSQDELREVLERGGRIPLPQLIRCKVRYFTAGGIIGSKEFVDALLLGRKDIFGENRKSLARGLGKCDEWDGVRLCSARQLRLNAITISS